MEVLFGDNTLAVWIIIFLIIFIFFVTRIFWLWYWKISHRVELQQQQLVELKRIKFLLTKLNKEK